MSQMASSSRTGTIFSNSMAKRTTSTVHRTTKTVEEYSYWSDDSEDEDDAPTTPASSKGSSISQWEWDWDWDWDSRANLRPETPPLSPKSQLVSLPSPLVQREKPVRKITRKKPPVYLVTEQPERANVVIIVTPPPSPSRSSAQPASSPTNRIRRIPVPKYFESSNLLSLPATPLTRTTTIPLTTRRRPSTAHI